MLLVVNLMRMRPQGGWLACRESRAMSMEALEPNACLQWKAFTRAPPSRRGRHWLIGVKGRGGKALRALVNDLKRMEESGGFVRGRDP